MRVIAGTARGRRLQVPPGDDVRPTQDRVREAVFSALVARDFVTGAHVLDLYAGSGAFAIEALSRGAVRAVSVERDRRAAAAIGENLATTGFAAAARVEARDVGAYLATGALDGRFDLVSVDPPYRTADDDVAVVLTRLFGSGWVARDGVVVVERPRRAVVVAPPATYVAWERGFGDTLVAFLQHDPHA